jgi:hypothetical protein
MCILFYAVGYFHGRNVTPMQNPNAGRVASSNNNNNKAICDSKIYEIERRKNGLILPFERTNLTEYIPGKTTDAYTYFHKYLHIFTKERPDALRNFTSLPMLHIWPVYFEAYHNHWQRYRGKQVVFMEIGVQSGGKIPMLREYFGSGLTYVGVDINNTTRKFDNGDWVHIEIGNSEDPEFLRGLKQKYPKVDIFLDDGGHTMGQQRVAIQEMLPHVQPDGVYMCEDLSTSWNPGFNGTKFKDHRDKTFSENTMVGLIHRTLDWLNVGWIPGQVMLWRDNKIPDDFWPEPWWREFSRTVKHIHYYNQLVVYEKGHVEIPFATKTVGGSIPYQESGVHMPVNWPPILETVSKYMKS